MSEFKPMVKMYTDEPSVELKLKKGGKVHSKKMSHGHKAMDLGHMSGAHHAFESEHGKAPKKPSMSERRKAMNPQLYKKGGKVAHKVIGGVMPGAVPGALPAAPMGAMRPPVVPMGRQAVMGMNPAQSAARAAMVRRALTGMKKGGSAEAECAKLEKELKHHEALGASKAHHKASGGEIDAAETRTTLKNSPKKWEKDFMVDGDHHDSVHGTGEVKEGKPGGYKHGGKIHHKATGGEIPSETNKRENKGKTVMGGSIEDNEGDYLETEMHEAEPDKAHGTGGVRMGNAGGYKRGGKMLRKAEGGYVPGQEANKKINREGNWENRGAAPGLTGSTIEHDGDWENRPADTSKPGKSNTKTGEVKEANAGGYRHGGKTSKKAYATGGNVVDDGKAEKMPHHFISQPVANSLQSGTFRKGGKVKRADGGPTPDMKEEMREAKESRGRHDSNICRDEDDDKDRDITDGFIRKAIGKDKIPTSKRGGRF
jgi:hypothetical protein